MKLHFILLLRSWDWGFFALPSSVTHSSLMGQELWVFMSQTCSNSSEHFRISFQQLWRASEQQVARKEHGAANFNSRMICSLKKTLHLSLAPLFTKERFGWGIEGRVSSVQPDGIPNPVSLGRELRGRCQNMFSIKVRVENTRFKIQYTNHCCSASRTCANRRDVITRVSLNQQQQSCKSEIWYFILKYLLGVLLAIRLQSK